MLTLTYGDVLPYVFLFTLMAMVLSMLAVKGLKEQGLLGGSFWQSGNYGMDQPPSNTIQKILGNGLSGKLSRELECLCAENPHDLSCWPT